MGAVEVDAGAERALTEHPNSLLPAGVVAVQGSFAAGDTVDIVGPAGRAFARGLAAVDGQVVRNVAGKRTGELPPGVNDEVVHRDDLVVLPS
jgi:glutamate 5-kinase